MQAFDLRSLSTFLVQSKLVTQSQLDEGQAEVTASPPDDVDEFLAIMEKRGYLTSFQTDKLRKNDRGGYFLGNYRLLYKIASGSFGRVYRADDPASGRVVAIKVLRNRWSENKDIVDLFEREGRVGMSLRHPNIVEIISVGKEPGSLSYFIVMEFVEGGNLRDILAIRKRFDVVETLKILEDVASALAYAFARGITHRDMKLSNVLISSSGVAKVVDFGLAQIFSTKFIFDDSATEVQRTVDYAGLEKATNAPFGDVRSDIYFMGCIAYEMLSGRPPLLLSKNKMERMNRERFLRVRPLRPDEIDGSPLVLRLLENMMAVDPAKRYQTPNQLLDAIKSIRAEVLSGQRASTDSVGPRFAPTVFVVESDERLQNALREKLKKYGYRVLLAGDPARAVDCFRQHPFHIILVDADTTRREGLLAVNQVLGAARAMSLKCDGVVITSEPNEVEAVVDPQYRVRTLTRPLNMAQLLDHLNSLAPTPSLSVK